MIQLTVNGDALELPTNSTVTDLLNHLQMSTGRVAVERNQQIVPRSQHAATVLQNNDTLEIVHAIGGG